MPCLCATRGAFGGAAIGAGRAQEPSTRRLSAACAVGGRRLRLQRWRRARSRPTRTAQRGMSETTPCGRGRTHLVVIRELQDADRNRADSRSCGQRHPPAFGTQRARHRSLLRVGRLRSAPTPRRAAARIASSSAAGGSSFEAARHAASRRGSRRSFGSGVLTSNLPVRRAASRAHSGGGFSPSRCPRPSAPRFPTSSSPPS